jgi:hypothetical protein
VSPTHRFQTIYCATQRACAFGETIARFRPSLETLSALETIEDDRPIDESLRSYTVPTNWRFNRSVGWIQLSRSLQFVDLHHASTITQLRSSLARLFEQFGITDLDLSVLTSQNRRLTQEIARFVYEQCDESGAPLFAGVRYLSRLHDQWECWAIFHDRMEYSSYHVGTIFPDDPGLLEAAQALGLNPPEAF